MTCHLGAGASLAAVAGGRSVDTTMGFTPLEGLVMATRSGTVDPGPVLWLQEHGGLPPAESATALEHESGLLGLAGTADMRAVLDRAAAGDPDAPSRSTSTSTACARRSRRWRRRSAASTGSCSPAASASGRPIRARAADGLAFLGIDVDRPERGRRRDREIGRRAPPCGLVVASREDLQIAREIRAVLGGAVEPR